MEMKEYFCRDGHQFDDKDVNHRWMGLPCCPYCWPNGFMVSRKPLDNKVTYENPQHHNDAEAAYKVTNKGSGQHLST